VNRDREHHRWALLRTHSIPLPFGRGRLLRRTRLLQTPIGGIYLHRIDSPEAR
jgi:hypothetical protein